MLNDHIKALPRRCKECGNFFPINAHNQIFCSLQCGKINRLRTDPKYYNFTWGERKRSQDKRRHARQCIRCLAWYKPVRVRQTFCTSTCRALGYHAPINAHYIDEVSGMSIIDLTFSTDAHALAVVAAQTTQQARRTVAAREAGDMTITDQMYEDALAFLATN